LKVDFRGKKLDIKNELNSKKGFYTAWNGYIVEVNPYETHYNSDGSKKLKYEGYCTNFLGDCICDAVTHNTISEAVQDCFNNIAIDIDDLKSEYDEIGECLKLIKEYL
jgi:bacterioferritin-associated ferredoxin